MSTEDHAPSCGVFTARMWKAAEEVLKATESHPFVEGLLDGTLPLDAFQFYIRQDSLYLKDFGRGLALLVSRSNHDSEAEHLLNSSRGTMLVEAAMHAKWSTMWDSTNPYADNGKAPHTELYTSWLMRHASLCPFEVAMCAFTPCFWVYLYIGKFLLAKRNARGAPSPVPCYEEWIQEYAGDDFEKSVVEMLRLVEHLGAKATEAQQEQMVDAFVKGCRMEWMFWDMGYKKQDWPI